MSDNNKLKEEIEHILQEVAESQNVKNYDIVTDLNVSVGDGFIGQFYTGKVKNRNTGEIIEVAIKKAPSNMDFATSVFKNEGLFYSTIIPELRKLQQENNVSKPFDNVPKHFCSNIEPKKQYIAMENLKLIGYTLYDKTKFLDEEHLEFVFKIYGQFHALSFFLKNENPERYKEIMKDIDNVFSKLAENGDIIKPMEASINAALEAVNTETDKEVYEKVTKLIDNCFAKVYFKSSQYNGDYSCITHGDCWSNNMLFKYQDSGRLEDVKLLDFQICHETTPIHDLSYFFYSGASKKDFDRLDTYLEIYYKSFSQFTKELGGNPEEMFPFAVLKREWKQYALMGVFLGIYLWSVKLMSKENIKEIMSEINASTEERMKTFQDTMGRTLESQSFKENSRAILIHACEYGII